MHAIPADLPDAQRVRDALESVLASGEFRTRAAPGESLLKSLWDGLRKLTEWIGDVHDALPILYWSVVACCVAALLAVLIQLLSVLSRALSAAPAAPQRGVVRRDASLRTAAAAMHEASVRRAAGDWLAALRLLYLAAVLALRERRAVTGEDSLTPHEIERALRATQPALLGDFAAVVKVYEPCVFGAAQPEPAQLDACARCVGRILAAGRPP